MTLRASSPPYAPGADPSPLAAADRANRHLTQAAKANGRAHPQSERALHHGASDGLDALLERRWQGRSDPLVGRLSSKARQLARHGMDLAGHAGSRAQESWLRYADVTSAYVARQPVRSVLVAAALGAAVALVLTARRKRS